MRNFLNGPYSSGPPQFNISESLKLLTLVAISFIVSIEPASAKSIEESYTTKIDFRSLGVADITKCKWDTAGWLFAAACSEPQAYDL